jgi:hypothetical protein
VITSGNTSPKSTVNRIIEMIAGISCLRITSPPVR